jgi:hypothetical protein
MLLLAVALRQADLLIRYCTANEQWQWQWQWQHNDEPPTPTSRHSYPAARRCDGDRRLRQRRLPPCTEAFENHCALLTTAPWAALRDGMISAT